jgi:AbrB family looped-hinge helix DNA binding protein
MIIKVKLGEKGQLVIPKIVRESVGLSAHGSAILEVKEKIVEIRPFYDVDVVALAEETAKKHGTDTSKWIKRVG